MNLENQFFSREITEGSSVARKRKSLIKRELEKVIINNVMLHDPQQNMFSVQFPHSLGFVFFSSSYYSCIQYYIFHFLNALGGKSREKAARKLISVKEVNEQN
jgi:hypothetical protein